MKKIYIIIGILCSDIVYAGKKEWKNNKNYKHEVRKLIADCLKHEQRLLSYMTNQEAAQSVYETNTSKKLLDLKEKKPIVFHPLFQNLTA